MADFIEKIEAAYGSREAREVKVPEWDMVFYVWPLTIKQLSAIQAESDPFMRAARIIQVRGRDQHGLTQIDQRGFDKLVMRGVGAFGPEIVARVAGEIMNDLPDAEAVQKN